MPMPSARLGDDEGLDFDFQYEAAAAAAADVLAALDSIQAHATHASARLCALSLQTLAQYAARCKQEADAPSALVVGDAGAVAADALAHGLDWPFVSELERARWKAHALRALQEGIVGEIDALAQGCVDAAQKLAADAADGDGGAALKQRARALSTAVYLDSGAATALVQEAMAHFKPVLQYVALGDVSA